MELPQNLGVNILFHAANNSDIPELLGILKDKEAEVNSTNTNGQTALYAAVKQNDYKVAEILLSFNADPNISEIKEVGGKAPLHISVINGNFDISRLLLDYGSHSSSQAVNGFTPLHYASKNGFKEIVSLLLAYGADYNLRDVNGFNASYWAKINDHNEVLELLPPPISILPRDFTEFKLQYSAIHDVTGKRKKKKGKGKKKSKK